MLGERRRSLQIDSDSDDAFDQKRMDQALVNRSQSHFIRAEPGQKELRDEQIAQLFSKKKVEPEEEKKEENKDKAE